MRFWTYINGWTRIKIIDGQELTYYKAQATEEGYSAETYTWALRRGVLTLEYEDAGRDCDGRHSSTVRLAANGELPAEPPTAANPEGMPRRINWERIESWQRDQYAELAGY